MVVSGSLSELGGGELLVEFMKFVLELFGLRFLIGADLRRISSLI